MHYSIIPHYLYHTCHTVCSYPHYAKLNFDSCNKIKTQTYSLFKTFIQTINYKSTPDWGFYETILCQLHLGSLLKDKIKVIKLIIRNWITEIMINQTTFFENHEVCELLKDKCNRELLFLQGFGCLMTSS